MKSFILNVFSLFISASIFITGGGLCAYALLVCDSNIEYDIVAKGSNSNEDSRLAEFLNSAPKGFKFETTTPTQDIADLIYYSAKVHANKADNLEKPLVLSIPMPPIVTPDYRDKSIKIYTSSSANIMGKICATSVWVDFIADGKCGLCIKSAGLGGARVPRIFEKPFVESFAEKYTSVLPNLKELLEKFNNLEGIFVTDNKIILVK